MRLVVAKSGILVPERQICQNDTAELLASNKERKTVIILNGKLVFGQRRVKMNRTSTTESEDYKHIVLTALNLKSWQELYVKTC